MAQLTTLASGSSVTLTVTDQQTIVLNNGPTDVARLSITTGPNAGRVVTASHNGRRVYGPFMAGTITVSAISGNVRYELSGDATSPLDDDGGPLSPTENTAVRALVSAYGNPLGPTRAGISQIRVGSFGDSIANINSISGHDLRTISGVAGMTGDRFGVALTEYSKGAIRIVFNGGISGQSTATMLARDGTGSSSTRAAITDALASGVQYLVFSCGINDFQHSTLPAGSDSATIEAAVAATVGRITQLLRRAAAFGMVPIMLPLLGYTYNAASSSANNTEANIPTTQDAVKRFNIAMKAVVQGANGNLGYWVDSFYSDVVDSTGNWLPGMSRDGLHPAYNGCRRIYYAVADLILSLAGVTLTEPASVFPVLTNLFTNGDFAASSSGLATGVTTANLAGTATYAASLNEWRGMLWQDILVTPTALASDVHQARIDLTYTNTNVALNDILGGEVSVYIDDGNSGAPVGLIQHAIRLRSNTVYSDTPSYNPTISPQVAYDAPVDCRVALLPIVAPGATPASSTLSIIGVTNSLIPYRIRIARPRVVELPAGY